MESFWGQIHLQGQLYSVTVGAGGGGGGVTHLKLRETCWIVSVHVYWRTKRERWRTWGDWWDKRQQFTRATRVCFCSKVNCWRMRAPAWLENGSVKGCSSCTVSPKLQNVGGGGGGGGGYSNDEDTDQSPKPLAFCSISNNNETLSLVLLVL